MDVQLHDWAHAFFGVLKPLLKRIDKTEDEAISDLIFGDEGLVMPKDVVDIFIVRLVDQKFVEFNPGDETDRREYTDPLHPQRGLMIVGHPEEPGVFCVSFFNYAL